MQYVQNEQLTQAVFQDLLGTARATVRMATANLKNVHLPVGARHRSILTLLEGLVERGVRVRLLCSASPSGPFQEELDRYTHLFREGRFDLRLCPRSHFKAVIVDDVRAYLGSANLTGAGLGAKSPRRRNFEVGVVTTMEAFVRPLVRLFDEVWAGVHCKGCGRREHCEVPLDTL